jgi:hypothetical protein
MTESLEFYKNKSEELEKRIRNLYNTRYRHKKSEEMDKVFGEINKLGKGAVDVLKAMTQASISNPLLGITTSLIFADILYRAKIIDIQTFTGIAVSVGILEGAEVASTVIEDVSGFFSIFKSQNPAPDPITPTANVVVLGSDQKDLQALLKGDQNL